MITRRPTINDVAKLAGVSIKTVSRVLNGEPNVRDATRDKVMSAAETLSYEPNLSARRLAGNRTFLIGLLYGDPNPNNENDYLTAVQSGSLQACRDQGYHLLISPCQADSPELSREILGLRRQVDGFIVLQPLSDVYALNRMLLEYEIPCVRVSQRPFEGFPLITVGDTDAADDLTNHLLELGHERIGFIVGHPEHGQSHDRLVGYRRALARWNIEIDPQLIEQGQFDHNSGYECAKSLLALDDPPTAIFASNDPMAMGVLSAAHEMGIELPGDLSVAGFDDSPMARHAWPPLTTVRQPVAEIARLATEALMSLLQDGSNPNSRHCVPAELVRRASTASPRPVIEKARTQAASDHRTRTSGGGTDS